MHDRPKGIHEVSATKPAMLGERNFDRLSPTALVEDAARHGEASDLMGSKRISLVGRHSP